jgi:hypothetical protein
VSEASRLLYVHLVAEHHLSVQLGPPAVAFARGVARFVPRDLLRLFDANELNELIGGAAGGAVDVEDLRAHTAYSGGYTPDSSAVRAFWRVVSGLPQPDIRALLRFVTSSPRAPLGGFRFLSPPFTIHKIEGGGASVFAAFGGRDVERLPTASTCFCMLKLPAYRREGTLREKLLAAIHSGSGFELS